MERHGAVRKKSLDFCYEQVALFKEASHLELIALQFATLEFVRIRSSQLRKARERLCGYPPGHLQGD
jgi:hypothetical protein